VRASHSKNLPSQSHNLRQTAGHCPSASYLLPPARRLITFQSASLLAIRLDSAVAAEPWAARSSGRKRKSSRSSCSPLVSLATGYCRSAHLSGAPMPNVPGVIGEQPRVTLSNQDATVDGPCRAEPATMPRRPPTNAAPGSSWPECVGWTLRDLRNVDS
jgi:hypothetical protein